MNTSKKCLAFDFGASSGRLIAGIYDGEKVVLEEIYRFNNEPIRIKNHVHWNLKSFYNHILNGLATASSIIGEFDSIGIDTWGVDYCLLDKEEKPLHWPFQYRDTRTKGISDEIPIPFEDFYSKTGIQFLSFNTVYQLFTDFKTNPELYKKAEYLLFMPDLFNHFLTGNMKTEYTIASTSQLLNVYSKQWDFDLINQLEFPKKIFQEIISPGEIHGYLLDKHTKQLGIKSVPIISVGSHDTASAVAGIPLEHEDSAYLICGTWSLLGLERQDPIINEKSLIQSFTNEGGISNTIRFLKNINGMFLLQQLRKNYNQIYNKNIDFPDIIKAAKLTDEKFYINPNHPSFLSPDNIIEAIRSYCISTKQGEPNNLGEWALAIYNGLTREFKEQLLNLEKITGNKISQIHMVGGGIQDELLCQLTANATNKKVVAGPLESSVMGNIMVQLYALGEFSTLSETRQVIKKSVSQKVYEPK
ncbi:rhamnulokinase [Peribacillus frigoritolerans]|uniref:rhamnulokinase n=1 Tax=Peribacillus frigoritolerans TaxID=450367 RepID=UPI0007BF5A2F|nr:rhamnulokinase family protein [Peribacillus frigoritolerans]